MEVPKSPIRKIRQRGQANFGRIHKQNVILNNPVTGTLSKLNFSCLPYNNILLTKLSCSIWENLDLGHVYRPHCVWSVLTTFVNIIPYRTPSQLIRAKYFGARGKHTPLKQPLIPFGRESPATSEKARVFNKF